jgi:hypothetical protein
MTLYGPDGRVVSAPDATREETPTEVLRRFAARETDSPVALAERTLAVLTVGYMLLFHLRGLVQDESGEIAAETLQMAMNQSLALGPAACCSGCGCTALEPCTLGDITCSWARPYLCSFCAEREGQS